MKNRTIIGLGVIISALNLLSAFYQFIYWYQHDNLSRMQLFKLFMWLDGLCLLVSVLGYSVLTHYSKIKKR